MARENLLNNEKLYEDNEIKNEAKEIKPLEVKLSLATKDEYIKNYIDIDGKVKELTNIQKEMKEEVKDFCEENNNNTLSSEFGSIKVVEAKKEEVDKVGLLNFIKNDKQLRKVLIKVVEQVDENALEDMLYNNQLTQEQKDGIKQFYKETITKQVRVFKK